MQFTFRMGGRGRLLEANRQHLIDNYAHYIEHPELLTPYFEGVDISRPNGGSQPEAMIFHLHLAYNRYAREHPESAQPRTGHGRFWSR